MTNKLELFKPYVFALLRIAVGYMSFLHGLDKLFGVFGGQVALASLFGVGGIIELVAGFLITIGLWTRWSSFLASGEMAFAYFVIHGSSGHILFPMVNQGEAALAFSIVFLLIFVSGPGALAVDNLRTAKKDNN